MRYNTFDLQTKDSYVSVRDMKTGQIGVSEDNKLFMKLYNGEAALLAGPGTPGDLYGTRCDIKVRILQPGSVVAITVG
jgi:hypothetical protein